MKYSFLMPFFNRHEQFRNTLISFVNLYADRDDFEIVVILDEKSKRDEEIPPTFNGIEIKVRDGGSCTSPSSHYNQAAEVARGQYLILTSPEVKHETDILAGFDKHLKDHSLCYVIAACKNDAHKLGKGIPWFQHTEHRPSNYHFCSCLHKNVFKMVNGFDELFSAGVGYDDNDFRDGLEYAGVKFVQDDSLITVHQQHEKIMTPERRRLTQVNRDLFETKCAERGFPLREN